MKTPYYLCRCQSLWLKVAFLLLLISAEASWTLRRRNKSNKTEYFCKNTRYLFEDVEEARVAACREFTTMRVPARRPLANVEDNDVNKMIFGWNLPLSLQADPNGKIGKNLDKITFNNRCELKDVLYYNPKSHRFESCQKIPDVVTSTFSENNQVLEKPFFQCGSMSWELEEIKQAATQALSIFLDDFVEIEHTSHEVDGPWKKAFLRKEKITNCSARNIPFEVIVNNQNEVRGVIVTHHITRISTVPSYFIKDKINKSSRKNMREKRIIKIECHLDTKLPLAAGNQEINTKKSHKRKTLA